MISSVELLALILSTSSRPTNPTRSHILKDVLAVLFFRIDRARLPLNLILSLLPQAITSGRGLAAARFGIMPERSDESIEIPVLKRDRAIWNLKKLSAKNRADNGINENQINLSLISNLIIYL
ncbi:MAG: hypothetical protein EAZ79_05560 [Oscillatoriales cyanobacterium]|nr:MAG: hypothetical protein EAZ79_05560 [Oscillatoriales cyanobacterium]